MLFCTPVLVKTCKLDKKKISSNKCPLLVLFFSSWSVASHEKHAEDKGGKNPLYSLPNSYTHTPYCTMGRGLDDRSVWWWMCCIYFLQTAGLQCVKRDRKGHWSTHTLAPILASVRVHLCMLVLILAAALSLSLTTGPLVEDCRQHPPFPSAPAQPLRPSACLTDRRSCHGDGWLCAKFQCQSPEPLLPAV